jgi:ADP-ribosylation factor-like protein 6
MGLKDIFTIFQKKKQQVKIVCCGLDNSGKTTIINLLKPKKIQSADITPTVGFSVENFEKNNLAFTVFDMSGQGKFRNLWESFYADVDGVIFVIDSSDRVRMAVANDELDTLLSHSDMRNVPILFFANKQDLPSALSAQECSEVLKLHAVKEKSWTIVASNALTGEGIEEGIKWMSQNIQKNTA